jgi:hypothetical protein
VPNPLSKTRNCHSATNFNTVLWYVTCVMRQRARFFTQTFLGIQFRSHDQIRTLAFSFIPWLISYKVLPPEGVLQDVTISHEPLFYALPPHPPAIPDLSMRLGIVPSDSCMSGKGSSTPSLRSLSSRRITPTQTHPGKRSKPGNHVQPLPETSDTKSSTRPTPRPTGPFPSTSFWNRHHS